MQGAQGAHVPRHGAERQLHLLEDADLTDESLEMGI